MAGTESYVQEVLFLNNRLQDVGIDYEKIVADAIEQCPSNMDSADLVYGVFVGILSSVFDTNDKVADFLDEIHQVASGAKTDNPLVEAIGNLLHHSGDWMDGVPTNKVNKSGKPIKGYVNRAAQRVAGKDPVWDAASMPSSSGPHRLFWGHDIFSCHEDNPFAILIKQYGVGRGILQALRHLVADTCSKQGLPLPGASYFDYIELGEDGSKHVRNHLLDFCQDYSTEVLGKKQGTFNNDVFNHLFSLRMQDVISSGFVAASISVYGKGKKIEDKTRLCQIRVVGYMAAAYGSAIIGAATHNGIVFINWPAFSALAKNVIQMLHVSYEETEKVIIETERLILEGHTIEERERNLRADLMRDLLVELTETDKHAGRDALIKFFEEE